ncbi:ribose 5-phosphate isomerase B [Lactobacillus colini]|uniref:Ribose 5-phosphate isomerase B n=1 Tax=Lactobacillus colini TaxID=1819254 RepID=A0ABS4MGF2_9LACO|nr:ribose 5-phosphate isomerase B [Lactobacillus colini]MBP2058678.1 ribose 5-phosphate isomerase B [Lactobacillus colini]
MRIAIGSDHVGLELKPTIIAYLEELGYEVHDFGTNSKERTDYPIYGKKVGEAVASGEYDLGIVICGTGVGISLAANKVKGIRACVCSDCYSAKLSRMHNNTNVLAFGSRVVGPELAKMIVRNWLDAKFIGGRHQRRIDELKAIEEDDDEKFEEIRTSTKYDGKEQNEDQII